ncbi:MAG: tRNA (adenine-N1)-methyltransferase [Chloroflexi bacterium]|nr:tRNA (adenine-N1)-methyltransferase [Chloroflexota bacterium]
MARFVVDNPRVFVAGDVVLIILDRKRMLIRLQVGQVQHTHHGLIRHDEVIGQVPGMKLATHLGQHFLALFPSLYDIIMSIDRVSQIIYPKEIGYILLKLNVGPGSRIVEGGTGSGALTIALAHTVRPHGRIYSYDQRDDMLRVATKNLTNTGLLEQVELKQRDIAEGFDERGVDALFLDVRTPWLYLTQVWETLAEGGFFGAVLPTANQVSELIAGLETSSFSDIEVCEILLRAYKPVAARLRPQDRMVAHTGYLVFARRLAEVASSVVGKSPDSATEAGCDTMQAEE